MWRHYETTRLDLTTSVAFTSYAVPAAGYSTLSLMPTLYASGHNTSGRGPDRRSRLKPNRL
jgi:hypothetical protein